jgi:CubicO group peptidase (beta-lactamase class C family)
MLFGFCAAHAQNLPADVTTKIDAIFDKWNKPESPGCALGVYRDGHVVYTRGYGMANLNDDVPITPSTVFHVASMSKQFTAASIILLGQQGKLSLDDDVHKYIPELPDFGGRITLRNLLHHTSGIRDQWALLDLNGWRYSQDLITDEDIMSVVARQKQLNFSPGEKMVYSNTGYTLLAIVVNRVSGLSLREFTAKNIFDPLGMRHTHFRDDHEEVIKHDALGYEQDGKDKPFRMNLTNFDTVGATSLHTTVEDLQLWDENFYQPRVGGPSFIQQMLDRGKLNSGETEDYASGLIIGTYKGLSTVDHNGGDAGYRSDLTRFPAQHSSVAVLCNLSGIDPGGLVRQVADVLLEKELQTTPETSTKLSAKAVVHPVRKEQMTAIAGDYWNPDGDFFIKVQVMEGKPQIVLGDSEVHELLEVAPSHFHVADVSWSENLDIHFIPASGDKPRRIEERFDGGKPNIIEAVASFEPSAAELATYNGAYLSPEIDPVYRITSEDGSLQISRFRHKPDALRPVTKDVFVGGIGTVRFHRDVNQKITSFTLDASRIQGLVFTREQ